MKFMTHGFGLLEIPLTAFLFRRGLGFKVEADLRARCIWYYGRTDRRLMLRALFLDGSLPVLLVRMAEAFRRSCVTRVFAWILLGLLKAVWHVVIGREAEFGPGLVLLHPFGVFIHTTVKAGANLILQNSVTLGGEDDQGPKLGDHVFVGVGARVIGPLAIGDRARIGANAVVMMNVAADHVAAGNPARQIPIPKG
jgi:serine O-acetyltransferase